MEIKITPMTKDRFERMHPFYQRTIRKGRPCYRLKIRNGASLLACSGRLYDALVQKKAVIDVCAHWEHIIVTNSRSALRLAEILQSRGVEVISIERGKGTFGDGRGSNFEAM